MCRVNGAFRRTDSTLVSERDQPHPKECGKNLPIHLVEEKGTSAVGDGQKEVNIFKVRSQLAVDSIETKITRRALQRVG